MKTEARLITALLAALAIGANETYAQVPVDEAGRPIEAYEGSEDGAYTLGAAELETLVAPIALYPDDLLAIVLPASTYPLQVVEAARFLAALEDDPTLEPDPDWDDSIVALVNYPEAVDRLNEDLDWTWQLGEAVIAQQADVINAVEAFRHRAYAAGNLESDAHQQVRHDEGIIEILPVDDDIIYVPYYEPEQVVVHQPRTVYHYYPEPRPVYYYPYLDSHAFHRGYFWGVTTAFTIGWTSDRVRVLHRSYRGHPYYGRRYDDRWWYRRPSISVHRTLYVDDRATRSTLRYSRGDRWRPNGHVRLRHADQRRSRSTLYPDRYERPRRTIVHNGARTAPTEQRRLHATQRSTRIDRERRGVPRGARDDRQRRENGIAPERRTDVPRARADRRSSADRGTRIARAEQRANERSRSRSDKRRADKRSDARAKPERREQHRREPIRRKAERRPR